ncbi:MULTISPECIES: nucleoside hydrolase-like domain-containing protein [Flavobacteriaceae]|uniref:nucleoside hydrolase-like domain-containing protein n=1 Tax=Flavobacteriaceae TaxID=49546 RepID=UPI0014910358|nr:MULTISPECIES: nucleoside hydrolase-like domain-containing protein [Allomuricauda]MDC6365924.1 DUF1593 domain-containing protein [Muricauda sp. AC10]
MVLAFLLVGCTDHTVKVEKPRVLISSDIGGTDPDDFQSMIHLLMYADMVHIEGLVSSPYGKGRKKDFLDIIDLYEKDLPKLSAHSNEFPNPDALRSICKQGATNLAPFKGYREATKGSNWIISCAKEKSDQPLWILVWGGLEDVAQALHDAPEIKQNIKVYWIGGPNKKWSVNAYTYIAEHHPDLWMIEANATYRGWFMDEGSPEKLASTKYYSNFIEGHGYMGKDFKNYYNGEIKMGDTPSLAYILNGDPNNPSGKSWGGSFVKIDRSSRSIFQQQSTREDTIAAYDVIEWRFEGPIKDIPQDSTCFSMKISGQTWDGYYLGKGIYGVRYSSKKPETGTYTTFSSIPELDGLTGQYTSVTPWPGKASNNDYPLGDQWYGDTPEPEQFLGVQQGAKTVAEHRETFLMDWAERWSWLK